ncbi:diguanylate cyclase domain-containing protein [Glaciecola siphonariae]|uniref:Diguanylate cyclase domain-containing protein n=1 Tax=Glaciecola siphonariae TaxID=521012 RepID=A0ABV9LY92_9ALTE
MSLSLRISLIIGFIAIAISSAVAFLHFNIQLDHSKEQSENLVRQMAQNDQGTSSIAAYLLDTELADEIVEGLANNDLIAFASITAHSEQLALAGINPRSQNNVVVSLKNPFDEAEQIGLLTVYPDLRFIQAQASSNSIQTAITLIALSASIAIIVGIFVHFKLTSPLRSLSEEFESVDTSNPEVMSLVDINYSGHDEIGKLIVKTNNLISALQSRFRSEKILRQTNDELQKRFRLLFEQATAGIALISGTGEITIANPAFKELFGKHVLLKAFADLFHEPQKVHIELDKLRHSDGFSQIDVDFVSMKEGKKRYLHCLFSRILDSREVAREDSENLIEVIVYDVTKRREQELKTRYEADHDSLTGLMNRRSGLGSLQLQLDRAVKKQQLFSLMMIDLDRFKPINDTYGHDAGDIVLRTISSRIKELVNEQEATLIRWGGDEFLLGLTLDGNKSITDFAESLMQSIQEDVRIDTKTSVQVGASIGIIRTLYSESEKVDTLITKADALMYNIKESGRNQYQISTIF